MPQNSSSRDRKPPGGTKATAAKAGAPKAGAAKAGPSKAAPSKAGSTKAASTKAAPSKAAPSKAAAGRAPVKKAAGSGGRPPGKPKSIVNQKQRPWGLIVTSIIVVLFAAGVIVFAVTRGGGKGSSADANYVRDEIAAAKAINGVEYHAEPNHTHVTEKVKYDTSPPVGGNHAQYWADCTGTVYTQQIANENAVHSLEHGAVWITYNPSLSAADVAVLAKKVTGVDRMLMSPYPGLKTPISLQAWDYQLFVDSATDPRIDAFISALKFNPGTTPEPNATCSNPAFKTNPSTPDKPTF